MTETERGNSVVHLVNFRWLTALRGVAIVGQTLAILFVHFWMEVPLPLLALFLIVGAESCVNYVAIRRSKTRAAMSEQETAIFVALDLVAFTALLFLTGGPTNPFTFFYVVHVAMASLILSQPYAWTAVGLSVASYGGLFVWHIPLTQAVSSWDVHLHGVWVAYATGVSCIVYFNQRARAELREREEWLAREAALRQQAERLSSLATLAAGAAHELASPLGTIAVISKELEHHLSQETEQPHSMGTHSVLADVQLVRNQVERCRKILSRMAHAAGEAPGEADVWSPLRALVGEAIEDLPEKARIETSMAPRLSESLVKCPKEALSQTLRVLLDNALDASPGTVMLELAEHHGELEILVTDSGLGMDPTVLQRAFDPFFTTKAPGKGMGLGLYLARNVVVGMGGSLELDSGPGRGTIARLSLPKERLRLQPAESPG